jgi:photosystem II stability/assembly factor-like uncharacterized protein
MTTMTDRAFVATRKGVFIITRSSTGTWLIDRVAFLADNASVVSFDPRDGAIYVALGHGHFGVKMHRSDDGGQTWAAIATPEYPPPAADAKAETDPYVQADQGKLMPTTLQLIWAIEPGGNPGEFWCGTIPGALFHSTDRGGSWRRVDSLWNHPDRKKWFGGGADWPGIHSICVHPRDPRHVAVGVSCGGMWVTRDGGQSWTIQAAGMRAEYMPPEREFDPVIQDPHRIVQCAANPNAMWAQHHNGIFRTTDGGAAWTEVKPEAAPAFGFAVCVHPKHGDTAWFVPAVKDEHRIPHEGKLIVTRTRDGGKTFDILRDGLPQEHAYDLVFRHGMDIDTTGDRLIFGSTTGSLWVTENGGDSWQTIAEHLPPIYCVRFANT